MDLQTQRDPLPETRDPQQDLAPAVESTRQQDREKICQAVRPRSLDAYPAPRGYSSDRGIRILLTLVAFVLILSSCTSHKQIQRPVAFSQAQTYAPYYVDPAMKPKAKAVQVPDNYYSHAPGTGHQYTKPEQPPSGFDFPIPQQKPRGPAGTLFGMGMALSGAAAGAQTYATPEMPFPQNATIVQPGRPPMYFYDNPMGGGTLIQPGKTPTYIYPY